MFELHAQIAGMTHGNLSKEYDPDGDKILKFSQKQLENIYRNNMHHVKRLQHIVRAVILELVKQHANVETTIQAAKDLRTAVEGVLGSTGFATNVKAAADGLKTTLDEAVNKMANNEVNETVKKSDRQGRQGRQKCD